MPSYIKAKLNDKIVYIPNDWKERDDFEIAPEEHITNGELEFYAALAEDSYAHCFGEVIKRYNEPIGKRSDLQLIEE